MMVVNDNLAGITENLPDLIRRSSGAETERICRRAVDLPAPYLPGQLFRRILKIRNTVQICNSQSGRLKTVTKGVCGQCGIVLESGKALFLCGCHEFSIDQEAASRIMTMGRDP